MENYSHEQFIVTGYTVTIPNPQEEMQIITHAWEKFQNEKISDSILGKEHDSLHAIYYNYTHQEDPDTKGYDMLIGFITKEDTVQTNQALTTITIPAQNYKYKVVKGDMPQSVVQAWKEINAMSSSELNRTFKFDMDMYNADGSEVTIAVSVQ